LNIHTHYLKIFLTLIIGITIIMTKAQDKNFVDSLDRVVLKAATDTGVIGAYGDLFLAYIHTEPQKALGYAEKGLTFSKEKKRDKSVSRFLNNIGYYYQLQGKMSKALDYYEKSLQIKKETGNKKGAAMTLVNIGNLYYEATDLEHALNYFLDALELFDQLEDQRGRAYCLNNVGTIYEEQKNYTKALDFYKHSLKIKRKIKDKPGTVRCLVNIGIIFTHFSDFDKALKMFNEAIVIAEEKQDKVLLYLSYRNMGETCMKMKKNKEAATYLEKALDNATGLDALDEIHDLYESIIENYTQTEDYRNAYNYQAEYIKLHDSIFSSQYNENIKLEKSKHEKEIAGLNKNIGEISEKMTAIKFLFAFTSLLIFLLVLFYFQKYLKRKNKCK